MATRKKTAPKGKKSSKAAPPLKKRAGRWMLRAVAFACLFVVLLVLLFRFVNPPTGLYMLSESRRLGGVQRDWVPLEQIAPVMARAAVAAEDANFCNHWGFDLAAIKLAIAEADEKIGITLHRERRE